LATLLVARVSWGLPPNPPPNIEAQVTSVIDGDTIDVLIMSVPTDLEEELTVGHVIRVRYIGIQAPEADTQESKVATEINASLVQNRIVYLELDENYWDRYGRLLAYVYLDPDGHIMVNAIMLAVGFANTAPCPPNVRYERELRELERTAQSLGVGLWARDKGGNWKEPTLARIEQAYGWGKKQGDKNTLPLWTVCGQAESKEQISYAQVAPDDTPCPEGVPMTVVLTPLAVVAQIGQIEALFTQEGLSKSEMLNALETLYYQGVIPSVMLAAAATVPDLESLRDVVSNEMTLFLAFEGYAVEVYADYESLVTQGSLVIKPFEQRTSYIEDDGLITVACRFKIMDLDPTKRFQFIVTQKGSGRQFLFVINVSNLGPGEFH